VRSALQHELLDKHENPPMSAEYMAFQTHYKQLSSLMTEHPDGFATRAFQRAMIDTSKLDNIRTSLTDQEKAAKLLSEIGQMIRASVPQAFERFLQILNLESDSTVTVLVVRELKSLMQVYKISTELKKSSNCELNLDVLAEKLLNKGLITREIYEQCTWTEKKQTLSNAILLFSQLSKQGASQAFLSILEAYPNTRDLADILRQESDEPSTSTTSEHSSSVVESSGYQTTDTALTDKPGNSTEPTQSGTNTALIGSVFSSDSVYSPESSTSSDQYHSLDSMSATMVSGTFTNEALSEGSLPSLERRSSPVSRTSPDTTISNTLSPHMSTPMVSRWSSYSIIGSLINVNLLRFTEYMYVCCCLQANYTDTSVMLKHCSATFPDHSTPIQHRNGPTARVVRLILRALPLPVFTMTCQILEVGKRHSEVLTAIVSTQRLTFNWFVDWLQNTLMTRPLPKIGVGLVQCCKGYALIFHATTWNSL